MAPHNSESIARRGEHLESIATAFLVVAWVFISLRVWTRGFLISQFGWDDSFMVFAGLIFSGYCACILYIEANGGGTHITSIAQLAMLTKWVIASEVTYIVTIFALKMSLGIMFARIIIERRQIHIIYVTLAITALSSISSIFFCVFRCGPDLDQYITRQLLDQCTSRLVDRFFAYQHAAVSFATDCVFALMPVLILWNVQMDRKWKIYVGLILSLAALGCVCSAIRFRYVDGLTQIEDFFWNATNISVWSTVEPGVAIMAICLSTLRPLLKWFRNKAQSVRSSVSKPPTGRSTHSSRATQSTTKLGTALKPPTSLAQRTQAFELQGHVSKSHASTERILPGDPDFEPIESPQRCRCYDPERQTPHLTSKSIEDAMYHPHVRAPLPSTRDTP